MNDKKDFSPQLDTQVLPSTVASFLMLSHKTLQIKCDLTPPLMKPYIFIYLFFFHGFRLSN